jgi:hypothetical protein
MILVEITHAPLCSDGWVNDHLVPTLQASVAKHMKAQLSDVEVRLRTFSEFDVHLCDFSIVVSGDRYPEPLRNPGQQQQIALDIRMILSNRLSVSLWVRPDEGYHSHFFGKVNNCVEAKRLLATLERGGKLAPESEIWLRNHVTVCQDCQPVWDRMQNIAR